MNFNDITDPKIKQMLKNAGISSEKLGKVDGKKLGQILSDPEMVQRIMSTPAAQTLLKKFKNE